MPLRISCFFDTLQYSIISIGIDVYVKLSPQFEPNTPDAEFEAIPTPYPPLIIQIESGDKIIFPANLLNPALRPAFFVLVPSL
jgi:hypothetical protein